MGTIHTGFLPVLYQRVCGPVQPPDFLGLMLLAVPGDVESTCFVVEPSLLRHVAFCAEQVAVRRRRTLHQTCPLLLPCAFHPVNQASLP